ncbi:SNL5, partial [Symbiodinium microadriaticum]
WKEILVKNYDRSLDHRSFYFRQQDKRSYSIRYLVDNIKDANGDNADLNIPGVSRTCSAEVLALCGDMIPQLYLTYKNE